MIDYSKNADILVQALPYIQSLNNKTIVIKYGGNAMISNSLKEDVISDIVLLQLVGIRVVLVHGGGPEISDMLGRLGKQSRFINGLRYTDQETMDVVQMVLAGKVNKDLVSLIQKRGGRAIGLCGLDGSLLQARQLANGEYGLVGEITKVNVDVVNDALDKGYIPVISTVAQSEQDTALNVNADTAAAEIASELVALKLVLLTDVRGILRDKDDEDSLISVIRPGEVEGYIQSGVIQGGMIPKVRCCAAALRRGVKRTHIIDGRIPHSILIEMLSNAGIGTMISNT